jgi:formate dehydrogenase maturation protein FdhE
MSTEFKNEVFSSYDPNPIRVCSYCGEKPTLLRSMLDTQSGRTVRMFKCNCGEQTWSEDKK